ncbi:uncharacterized protein DS421_4g110440 [Arachis hypogaea]|nr:uncharacterized protein DS421_4g110440 [Arachis hypogaea]
MVSPSTSLYLSGISLLSRAFQTQGRHALFLSLLYHRRCSIALCRKRIDGIRPDPNRSCSKENQSIYLNKVEVAALEQKRLGIGDGSVGMFSSLIVRACSFIEENNAGNAAAALMARLAPKAKVWDSVSFSYVLNVCIGYCQYLTALLMAAPLALGLANYCVPAGEAYTKALEVARNINEKCRIISSLMLWLLMDLYRARMEGSGEWGDHLTLQAAADKVCYAEIFALIP